MLEGKKITIGLCGGIAVYHIASLVRKLVKFHHADVHVIMTDASQKFITPLIFETFTGKKVVTTMFPENEFVGTRHIDLATESDVILIAPATANIIGKAASGIADDFLSTVTMAGLNKTVFALAMNTNMYENSIVQSNIAKVENAGASVILPISGELACNTFGIGHLEENDEIIEYVIRKINNPSDMTGKNVLITGGATEEAIDPVRKITNYSSGKMGANLALSAYRRGANVTWITGRTHETAPKGIRRIDILTAEEMDSAVKENQAEQDILVFSAAVEDFKPHDFASQKIKKNEHLEIKFTRTVDVLKNAGMNKNENQYFAGFALETEHAEQNALAKMKQKNCDCMVVNSPEGLGGNDNSVTLIFPEHLSMRFDKLSKLEIADKLFDSILKQINE